VCSLARANDNDVRKAGEAIKGANSGAVHTFIATSPIHMKHKLRMEPDQVLEAAVRAVKLAREYTDDVEFSAEDAVRSDMDFLCRIFEATIAAGARTINVPDTVGYSVPELWGDVFKQLLTRVPNAGKAVWSTHCHNDLGMAVANSLAAVMAGARQVECTINGLGERAGNASLEEIVMAVKTRSDVFKLETRIDTTQIVPASKLVSTITGYPVQPNKAVVGRQRLRARVRNPPGRRAQASRDLRDHAGLRRRLGRQPPHARQALGPQRVQEPAAGARASRSPRRRRSTPRSPASRSSPTRSARSSTRTSRRCSPTRR
jgi:isopropylmalate/homocitrate/citramalate synthase